MNVTRSFFIAALIRQPHSDSHSTSSLVRIQTATGNTVLCPTASTRWKNRHNPCKSMASHTKCHSCNLPYHLHFCVPQHCFCSPIPSTSTPSPLSIHALQALF